MKTLKETLLNESKTRLEDIENYGKSWVNEWGVEFFGNILSSFTKGMKKALDENSQYYIKDEEDKKFVKRCSDFINKISEDINKDIY